MIQRPLLWVEVGKSACVHVGITGPEGGDPYLGVRFGYGLGTFFSVLWYDLDRTWVRFFPYLVRTWVRFGSYLVTVWIVLGCGLGRTWVRLGWAVQVLGVV